MIGDGDFSFSLSLSCKLPVLLQCHDWSRHCLIATSLNTADELSKWPNICENIETLCRNGATVLHGVNATCLNSHQQLVEISSKISTPGFDRITFNFPHAGGKGNIAKNRSLLKDFFKSAVGFLRPDGELHVALCKGQGGTQADCIKRGYSNSWKIVEMAAEAGLFLTSVTLFVADDYPGYTPSGYRGQAKGFVLNGALNHVFSLPQPSPSIIPWRGSESCVRCLHCTMADSTPREFTTSVTTELQAFLCHPLLGQPWHPVALMCGMLERAFKQSSATLWAAVESEICEHLTLHTSTTVPRIAVGACNDQVLSVLSSLVASDAQDLSSTPWQCTSVLEESDCKPPPPVPVNSPTKCQPLQTSPPPPLLSVQDALQQTTRMGGEAAAPKEAITNSCSTGTIHAKPSSKPHLHSNDAGGCTPNILRLISHPVIKGHPDTLRPPPLSHEVLGILVPLAHSLPSTEALLSEHERVIFEVTVKVLAQSQSLSLLSSGCLQANTSWHHLGDDLLSRQLRLAGLPAQLSDSVIATCGLVQSSHTNAEERRRSLCETAVVFAVDLNCLAMLYFGIHDARLLWSDDTRFVSQFSGADPCKVVFVPFNLSAPSYVHDVSFWSNRKDAKFSTVQSDYASIGAAASALTTEEGEGTRQPFSLQQLVTLVRRVSGGAALSVSCVDTYHPPNGSERVGLCYRVVYQSALGPLSSREAGQMQLKLRELMQRELDIELR